MATQYPLHCTAFSYKLSTRYQLNCLPIDAKPIVAQDPPNTQSKSSPQSFGFIPALKQSQLSKLKTFAALKVKLQYTTTTIVDVGTGMDVYQFTGTYDTDIITDKGGQGFISIDNTPANSGTFRLENIYKNEGTGYTFTQVNGGSTLIISKEGDANRIIINDWSAGDLSINLTGSAPTTPQATLSGDFKKLISHYKTLNKQALDYNIAVQVCNPHRYWVVACSLLFNLIMQKPVANAANDAVYENDIERKAA